MREYIPDNEVVLEELSKNVKIVKTKQKEKYVWLRHTERWLGVTEIFKMSSQELYEIYDKLQPFIEKERERVRNLPRREYKKISLPKINREYPPL
jgi:hypothetical protein